MAPCLLQASLLDELKSNFRSGIFIPPVRPKLPPAIIAAATLARKDATLKRVASTASLPLSPLSRSISEASKSSSASSSFSSTKSVKGGDDDEAEEEVEDDADDFESRNTGGGNHPLTLFEELQNFIRFGRLRHVEPRVKQVATATTATLFNEDSFRNFRYPLFQRMVSAPALLPSPYFPARAPARPALQVRNARLQEEKEEGRSDNSTPLENHHQQEEEEEEKEKKEDIHENNPPPPKQKTFILRPQKTPPPPPPPPPQIIQYHPFPPLEDSEVVKVVDPDGNNNNGNNGNNNNGNAQFRACQLTPVPCAEHGTDLVVQQEQQDQDQDHQDLITPEKTPFGLLTGQPCRRRALSFASDDHQADGGEEEEDYMSSKSENEISSSKEPPLLALLDRQEN